MALRQTNHIQLLRPIELKPMNSQISILIRSIRNTVKPIITSQITQNSKSRFVEIINQFETQNNYSIKRPRFLDGLQSEALKNLFKGLTKYHLQLGGYDIDLLNKGIQFLNRNANRTQISTNLECDIKRLMEYVGSKMVNEYKRNLDMKLKKMRKNKELLNLKLEHANFHPQLSLLKISHSSRILMGIHDKKRQVELKYGKFALISDVQSEKERILSTINTRLI